VRTRHDRSCETRLPHPALLAMLVILLFLALTGELTALRRDVQRLHAHLGSAPPWHEALSHRRFLLMICLCASPWSRSAVCQATTSRRRHVVMRSWP